MAVIDVGNPAVAGTAGTGNGYTIFTLANPATANGKIYTVEFMPYSDVGGIRFGTFFFVRTYVEDSTTYYVYQCRDSTANLTDFCPAGVMKTYAVTLVIKTDDYIGCYLSGARWIAFNYPFTPGIRGIAGEHINPGDEFTAGNISEWKLSLHGIGATIPIISKESAAGILQII